MRLRNGLATCVIMALTGFGGARESQGGAPPGPRGRPSGEAVQPRRAMRGFYVSPAGNDAAALPADVQLLYRGDLPRGDVAPLLGAGERHARRIVAELSKAGVLTSGTSKSPLRLAFPATLASRWMPGLFPERTL